MKKILCLATLLPVVAMAHTNTNYKINTTPEVKQISIPVLPKPSLAWNVYELKVNKYDFQNFIDTIAYKTHDSLAYFDKVNNIATFNNSLINTSNVSSNVINENVLKYFKSISLIEQMNFFDTTDTLQMEKNRGYIKSITTVTNNSKKQTIMTPGIVKYGTKIQMKTQLYNNDQYIQTQINYNQTSLNGKYNGFNELSDNDGNTIQLADLSTNNIKTQLQLPINGTIVIGLDSHKILLLQAHKINPDK